MIKTLEGRLNIVITLALFLPVLLQALSSFENTSSASAAAHVLGSGLMIFFIIANYVTLATLKHSLSPRILHILDWTYLFMMLCFGVLFLIIGFAPNEQSPSPYYLLSLAFIFPAAFTIVSFAPIGTLFVMLFAWIHKVVKG